MKHNAYSRNNPVLTRVWGPDDLIPQWTLPDHTPVFVCWSPHLRRWVMSITTLDYRYDALVTDHYFRLDPALQDVVVKEPADTYYLNKIRENQGLHDA